MKRSIHNAQRRAAVWLLLAALCVSAPCASADGARPYVDFSMLQTDAPHLVAWLIQPDIGVSEPVLQAKNNSLYDDILPNGRRGDAGAICIDKDSQPDFTDEITYLYGSADHEGARFSFLSRYADAAYYESHPSLRLLTPYGDFEIAVFACVSADARDNKSWRSGDISEEALFAQAVRDIAARSLIQSEIEPLWGERIVALCGRTDKRDAQRQIVFGRLLPIADDGAERYDIIKRPMDEKPTISARKQVGALGEMMVYAQNDPLWADMTYESNLSSKKRTFGDAGCGPTAVANALVNLLPEQALPELEAFARYVGGFAFCSCSVNHYHCREDHLKYHLQTWEEFLRYYPVALASFAAGNNRWKRSARSALLGTDMRFCAWVAEAYGLVYSNPANRTEALRLLEDGAMIVCNTAGRLTPFTGGGHYVTLVGKDDEYLYILDPLWKEDYSATDKRGVLDVLSPGVLRAKLSDFLRLQFFAFHAFSTD